MYSHNGPTPKICWPHDLDDQAGLLIAVKTISLLIGDVIYQEGIGTEGVNYFGILPFPDLKLNG